jgi:hypothetical protein
MITGLIFFLKRVGFFIVDNWRVVVTALAILLVLIASGLTYQSCQRRSARLNQQEIIDLQKGIAENDRKVLEKILVDSDVREKQIDGNVANAKAETVNAIAEAKKRASELSNEALAEELNRRAREQ